VTVFAKITVISVKYTAISRLSQARSNYDQRVQCEFRAIVRFDGAREIDDFAGEARAAKRARESVYCCIKNHARESLVDRIFDLS